MLLRRRIVTWIVVVLASTWLVGCVTEKKKGSRSALGKLYENTTARYNGYYNATVLLDEALWALNEQHQDNFNALLPLYPYMAADNVRSVSGSLDEAIKKVSRVVTLHRSSRWTDDCYLLMGKAQFLKRDYESAEATLEYLVEEFPPDNPIKDQSAVKKDKPTPSQRKKAIKVAKKTREKTRKEREKEIKRKRKEREKERKRYKKEIARLRKARKKGKTLPARTKKATPATDQPPKKEVSQQSQETDPPAEPVVQSNPVDTGGMIRLGTVGAQSFVGQSQHGPLDKIKHRPAYHEGMLWLARAYTERGRTTEAHRILTQMMESEGTYEELRKEVALALAWLYLKENKPVEALPWLDEAITRTRRGPEKARYYFIKGQLLQQLGRTAKAARAFELVGKSGATYELVFNAQLNQVYMRWLNKQETAETAIQQLQRMLKDEKNTDYHDRIYFIMAKIALDNGKRDQAIAWLQQSVQTNTQDQAQKAESYLMLADLYFEDGRYVEAKDGYEAALQAMSKQHPRYAAVKRLADHLTDIAKYIQTIELQDSLLAISRMSEAEKLKLAKRIKKEQEERRRQALLANSKGVTPASTINKNNPRAGSIAMAGTNGARAVPLATSGSSSFFAYDDRALRKGLRDFKRVWGDRPLVDNWRLASKIKGAHDETVEGVEDQVAVQVSEEDLSSILADVPDTEEEVQKAHTTIMEAMFKLGGLYRQKLQAYDKAAATLEQLLKRYPDNPYKLDALYLLYLTYSEMGNTQKANQYKELIVAQYPTSDYARLLSDPNYARAFQDKQQEVANYYQQTYALFEQGQYEQVIQRVDQVGPKFGSKHELMPRFALLKAMSLGAVQGKDAYVNALKDLIGRWPDTPEAVRAREILRLLGVKVGKAPIASLTQGKDALKDSPFKYEEGKLHYVLAVFEPGVQLNQAKANIADYNGKYHRLDKLRISNIYLGPPNDPTKLPLIVIRRFPNKEKAMAYYEGVMANKEEFVKQDIPFEVYPITQNNYREVLKQKSLDGYRAFFETYYLGQVNGQ